MEEQTVAFSCKTLKLAKPIHGINLSYFGGEPVHPDRLDEARSEGLSEGETQASERHNAQILEYREELQALHDEVLGSIEQRFQELCAGMAELLPALVVEVAQKALPLAEIEGEAVEALIDGLVADNGGADRVLKVQVGERDFGLLGKMMKADPAATELKHGGIQVEQDSALGPGDCILHSEYGLIDATIGTRMKHIKLALEVA